MWSWCCTSADLQVSSAVKGFSWVLCSSFWHGRFHPNSQRKFHPNTGINHYDHYVYICLHSWVQMTVRTPLKYVLSPVSRNVMQSLVSSYIHLYTVGEETIMIVKFCHHDLQIAAFDIFWPFPPILARELRPQVLKSTKFTKAQSAWWPWNLHQPIPRWSRALWYFDTSDTFPWHVTHPQALIAGASCALHQQTQSISQVNFHPMRFDHLLRMSKARKGLPGVRYFPNGPVWPGQTAIRWQILIIGVWQFPKKY